MPSSRVRVTRDGARTAVRVAAPRSWTMIVFLLFWMIGWAGGEVATWRSLTSADARPSAYGFIAVWLLVWTAGGVAGALGLLWGFAGHEVVAVDGEKVTLRRAAGPVGKTWSFPLGEVRDLRYLPPTTGGKHARPAPGMVGFEHGKRPVRFGTYLGAEDGGAIVAALAPALPASRTAR